MPCSVPIHPWEEVMAAQGGALIKADHQKADDAAVPTELWDRFLRFALKENLKWDFPTGPPASQALDMFRRRCLRWWRRRVFTDFWRWRQANYPLRTDAGGQPWVTYWPDGYLWKAARGRRARPRQRQRGCFRWRGAVHGESPPGRKFYLSQMRAVRIVTYGQTSLYQNIAKNHV